MPKRMSLDNRLGPIMLQCSVAEGLKQVAPNGTLRAWIEHQPEGGFVASFIGVATFPDGHTEVAHREPAMLVCGSLDKARQWIENEAIAFGLPVEWVEKATA